VTRNRGFQHTHPQSEFVAFLDSDDTWEPGALALLVDALERHPEHGAAHGLARSTELEGRQYESDDLTDSMRQRRAIQGGRFVDLPISAPTTFEAVLVKNYLVTPGTSLIRRRLFESLGGYEPATVPCDDWDMNLRIARNGGFFFADRVILNWRRHPDAISNTSRRWRQSYLAVRKRAIRSADNTPTQRQAARFAFISECRGIRGEALEDLKRGEVRSAGRALARALLFHLAYYCS